MKVCVMGTCRVSTLKTKVIRHINKYMNGGGQSKIYEYNQVKIHTQPITYTTKLSDVRDCLKYLHGKIYNNIDPNNDINFFKIFFRGIDKKAFDKNMLIKPNEIIDGNNNNYDLFIFEICSLREIIFKTTKYGKQYYNKNLNWNIDVGSHNTIDFKKEDFEIIHNDKDRVNKTLEEICILCKNKPILIIGPYLLKKDTISKTPWGDIDLNKYDYVNQSRKDVQNLLLESINRFDNIDYFDMSEYVKEGNILVDQYHFNKTGKKILSDYILKWIDKHIY